MYFMSLVDFYSRNCAIVDDKVLNFNPVRDSDAMHISNNCMAKGKFFLKEYYSSGSPCHLKNKKKKHSNIKFN